jgi:hypothetical protein
MNKLAIALAADSAVTITTDTGDKVYNTANKLFTLSKLAPVGLLLYNATEINGLPVEVIVKEFRENLGARRFKSLDSYADRFWSFLEKGPPITENSKERNLGRLLHFSFREIYLRALRIRADDSAAAHPFNVYLHRAIDELGGVISRRGRDPQFEDVDVAIVATERKSLLDSEHDGVRDQFKREHDLPDLTEGLPGLLNQLALGMALSRYRLPGQAGIVIAGYGDSELPITAPV